MSHGISNRIDPTAQQVYIVVNNADLSVLRRPVWRVCRSTVKPAAVSVNFDVRDEKIGMISLQQQRGARRDVCDCRCEGSSCRSTAMGRCRQHVGRNVRPGRNRMLCCVL